MPSFHRRFAALAALLPPLLMTGCRDQAPVPRLPRPEQAFIILEQGYGPGFGGDSIYVNLSLTYDPAGPRFVNDTAYVQGRAAAPRVIGNSLVYDAVVAPVQTSAGRRVHVRLPVPRHYKFPRKDFTVVIPARLNSDTVTARRGEPALLPVNAGYGGDLPAPVRDIWMLRVARGERHAGWEYNQPFVHPVVVPTTLIPDGLEDLLRVHAELERRYDADDPAGKSRTSIWVKSRFEWTVRILPAQPSPAAGRS